MSKLESMLLFLEALQAHKRLAIRRVRRDRATSISIVSLLCIGIGSSTAVFSVVDRVLFRRLPYANSDRLVSVGIVAPLIYPVDWLFSATYQDWRTRETPFEAISSWVGISDCDLTENRPSTMRCARVESNFLPTLGVTPLIGRNISPGRPAGRQSRRAAFVRCLAKPICEQARCDRAEDNCRRRWDGDYRRAASGFRAAESGCLRHNRA